MIGARAELMEIAGKSFAAGPRLTNQQYGGWIGGDLLQLRAQLLHLFAFSDRDHQGRREKLARLPLALARIQRTLDGPEELREGQRLLHEIKCTQTGRLDGGFHSTVP